MQIMVFPDVLEEGILSPGQPGTWFWDHFMLPGEYSQPRVLLGRIPGARSTAGALGR